MSEASDAIKMGGDSKLTDKKIGLQKTTVNIFFVF